jgi:hypothetical protein
MRTGEINTDWPLAIFLSMMILSIERKNLLILVDAP